MDISPKNTKPSFSANIIELLLKTGIFTQGNKCKGPDDLPKYWSDKKKSQEKAKLIDSFIDQKYISKITVDDFLDNFIYRVYVGDSKPKKAILYMHGGGWVRESDSMHYNLVKKLSIELDAVVYFVDYPLLPNINVKEMFDYIIKGYYQATADYRQKIDVVMGDSAGATFTLYLASKIPSNKQPSKFIALSPDADLNMPDFDTYPGAKKDLVLNWTFLDYVLRPIFKKYNHEVSPLYLDYQNLVQSKAKLTIFTSGKDLLHFDVEKLHQKLLKEKIDHDYYFDKFMFHDWIIFPFISESKEALQAVFEELKKK